MIEIRPSVTHFASAAWGRNLSIAAAAFAALILAFFGSRLGLLIVVLLVLSEGVLALQFLRPRLRGDASELIYTPVVGPTKRILRSRLHRVELGRPMTGVVGRPRRVVFSGLDGGALLALDPAVWSPNDVARLAAEVQLPVVDWRQPPARSGFGHAIRLAIAGLALVTIVAAAVAIVVLIVLLR